jgi:pyruvate formate lyase activating enzyme
LQAEGLIPLFRACREKKFHTALDTNGAIVSDTVRELYDLSDLIILDVKHIDEEGHKRLTGASLHTVFENARYREQSGKPLWLRYVLVPGYNDQSEVVERWAKYFAAFRTVERVDILPYHTLGVHKYEAMGIPYALNDVQPPDEESIQRVKKTFEQYLQHVEVS